MFRGNTLKLERIEGLSGLVELVIDQQKSSVNSINSVLLEELAAAVQRLEQEDGIRGLLLSSAKPAFVVGADIFAFPALIAKGQAEMRDWIGQTHTLFNRLEALPFPTVAAVNGMALGGGLELALTADARVIGSSAKLGLPEVTLGLCPGWGGTVRTSRLIGVPAALQMMVTGKPVDARKALQLGLADSVTADAELRNGALELLSSLVASEQKRSELRHRKQVCADAEVDSAALIEQFAKQINPNYPAAQQIIETVCHHAGLAFDAALQAEAECFASLAATDTAKSLIGLFINGQALKQRTKGYAKQAGEVKLGAVLGAGIMGGGIAYQSAITGTPVLLKDIRTEALDLGIATATKALDKQIERGRLDESAKQRCLEMIHTTLDYSGFDKVDLVVEAVVENIGIKASVLSEVEAALPSDAILTSNTSTISITELAKNLARPEQFCGMHFFNPVPMMPLVEVIRGEQTSAGAVATAVAYAAKMGKTPIVVNDCPGFLVNRVLFPYFNAFNRLLHDGVDFQRIDRVMEAFGWPMGPAYLADVVGLDTMVHADRVMQQGFPQRMGHDHRPIIEALVDLGALGQKNGWGFYDYSNGPRNKSASTRAVDLIASTVDKQVEISDQQIIDRMMVPMCLESYLCLDEGIVGSAAEVDMGLIMGIGFPKFRGGALRYIDHQGHTEFAARVDALADLGPLYQLPESFRVRAQSGESFF